MPKLTRVKIRETSGVDHPAHLHPGWLVMKAAGGGDALALARALGRDKENRMPKLMPTLDTLVKSLEGVDDFAAMKAAFEKADETAILKEITDADVQPLKDGLAELWKIARDLTDKGSPDTPSVEGAPVAADAESLLASEALTKAIGPEGTALLKAMHEQTKSATEQLEKAQISAAETLLKSQFGSILGDEVTELAKALRSMDAVSPEASAAVRKALETAKSANDAADVLITGELGVRKVASGSPEEKLQTLAKAIRDADPKLSPEMAYTKAVEANPDLYEAQRAQKAV